MTDVAARNRLTAAKGILADFDRACAGPRLPDWQRWAYRLAGTLSSVLPMTRETQARNAEWCAMFEDLLEKHKGVQP